jgi:hypothetical protein
VRAGVRAVGAPLDGAPCARAGDEHDSFRDALDARDLDPAHKRGLRACENRPFFREKFPWNKKTELLQAGLDANSPLANRHPRGPKDHEDFLRLLCRGEPRRVGRPPGEKYPRCLVYDRLVSDGAPDAPYSSASFAFGFDVVRVDPWAHADRSSSRLARARTKHGVSDQGRRSAEKQISASEWCARSDQVHRHPSRPWGGPVRSNFRRQRKETRRTAARMTNAS